MKAFQDIDQAINRIRTFPDDIERPEVRLQSRQRDVLQIGLYGQTDIWTLRQLAERLRTILLNNPKITQVELGNVPDYETHIEIPRSNLQKYKNSRYDKRSNLFGLNKASKEIRRKSRALLVEGYFDALQCWQHGFNETVACQGTALTREHLSQLSLHTKNAYLLFDGEFEFHHG